MFAVAVVAIVIAVVLSGFWLLGSPAHQRNMALDRQRVSDLEIIRSALAARYKEASTTPERLDATYTASYGAGKPVSASPFEYHRIDREHYELCTSFLEPADADSVSYRHGRGRTCYRFDQRDRSAAPSELAPVGSTT